MTYIKYLAAIAVSLNLVLIGCSSSKEQTFNNSPSKIYLHAQKKIQEGNWKQAIMQLELLDNYYPFSQCAKQVQLDLIYTYYKNNDLFLAQSTIEQFIRLNPTHPNIDYVMYMHGLINMELDNNMLQDFFGIDRSDCNPQYARESFNDFSKLIHNYPHSHYLSDAMKCMIFLKNRLAKYEYSIANYYASRGAWVAVVNRVEDMLRNYPDTQVTRYSLKLMEHAYRQMQLNIQADKVRKIIVENKNTVQSY